MYNGLLWLMISISFSSYLTVCSIGFKKWAWLLNYLFCLFLQSYCSVILLAAVCCSFLQKLAGSRKAKKKKPGPAKTVSTKGTNINIGQLVDFHFVALFVVLILLCFVVLKHHNNTAW